MFCMEEPQDLISKHIRFSPEQIDFLEKKIDEEISSATRKVVKEKMSNTKVDVINRHLFIFGMGVIIIFLSLLFVFVTYQPLITASMMMVGIVYICYTMFSIIQWRLSG